MGTDSIMEFLNMELFFDLFKIAFAIWIIHLFFKVVKSIIVKKRLSSEAHDGYSDSSKKHNIEKHQKKISSMGKEATQLKKESYDLAAKKIEEALTYAKKHDQWVAPAFALRLPSYLAREGKFDEAYNWIERIKFDDLLMEPLEVGSAWWYSKEATFLRTRLAILAREDKYNAWVQYIYDSFLNFYYEAMNQKMLIKLYLERHKTSKEMLEDDSSDVNLSMANDISERLAQSLTFKESSDLKKFGLGKHGVLEALKKLNLQHCEKELLKAADIWSKDKKLNIDILTSAFENILKREFDNVG